MAKSKGGSFTKTSYIPGPPKKSRQGMGLGTKHSATSRNGARKKYRGQGK
jgi:hypothetical protein